MRVKINGNWQNVTSKTLAELVIELDYAGAVVATACNHEFVRATERSGTRIVEGDEIEILVPMQGG